MGVHLAMAQMISICGHYPHEESKAMKSVIDLCKEVFTEWSEDKVPRLAAALAFYTLFSLAPLLVIVVVIAGMVFGEDAATGALSNQIGDIVGESSAELIETAIANASTPGAGILPTILGVATLLFGATGVFTQLQDSLNTIWNVQPQPGQPIMTVVRQRLLAFVMVLLIGLLLIVSLIASTVLTGVINFIGDELPYSPLLINIFNNIFLFLLGTLLFATIFKILPDVKIAWSEVWLGAAVSALLFTLGRYLIGSFLVTGIGSIYGAAGSLAITLLWVYYSGLILFLGAEFTQVYARRHGTRIMPTERAVAMTDETRAQQGIPRTEYVQSMAEKQERHT